MLSSRSVTSSFFLLACLSMTSLSPMIHPFGLSGFLLLADLGCAAGAPVVPVAVAVAVLSKLGV